MADRTPHSMSVSLHLLGSGRIGAKRMSTGTGVVVWFATAPDTEAEQTVVGVTMTEQDARRLRALLDGLLGEAIEVRADA